MPPVVSIIVPCFNYAQFIPETLNSIQKQTFANWECIIVDDGSTDNTREIVEKFCNRDKRFLYLYQDNQGLSSARNTGLNIAKGTYIQFLDSDDLLSESKLQLQTEYMLQNPDVTISYTDAFYFGDNQKQKLYKAFFTGTNGKITFSQKEWIPKLNGFGLKLTEILLWRNLAPVNSMLSRKDFLINIGGFKSSYKSLEDWELWARCALSGAKFSFFESNLAYSLVRVHTSSMTFDNRKMELFFVILQQDILSALRKLKDNESRQIIKNNTKRVNSNIKSAITKIGLTDGELNQTLRLYLSTKTIIAVYISAIIRYIKGRK